jgi:hypothetical protein
MQVISDQIDRPTVYFEAPVGHILGDELNLFIQWINMSQYTTVAKPTATRHLAVLLEQ